MTMMQTLRTRLDTIAAQRAKAAADLNARAIAGDDLTKLGALVAQIAAADAAHSAIDAEFRRAVVASLDAHISDARRELAEMTPRMVQQDRELEAARVVFAKAEERYPLADPRIAAYAVMAKLEESAEAAHRLYTDRRDRLAQLEAMRRQSDIDYIADALAVLAA